MAFVKSEIAPASLTGTWIGQMVQSRIREVIVKRPFATPLMIFVMKCRKFKMILKGRKNRKIRKFKMNFPKKRTTITNEINFQVHDSAETKSKASNPMLSALATKTW